MVDPNAAADSRRGGRVVSAVDAGGKNVAGVVQDLLDGQMYPFAAERFVAQDALVAFEVVEERSSDGNVSRIADLE